MHPITFISTPTAISYLLIFSLLNLNPVSAATLEVGPQWCTNGVGLDLISLHGKDKVDGQWKLYALLHNVEKLAHHGYAS